MDHVEIPSALLALLRQSVMNGDGQVVTKAFRYEPIWNGISQDASNTKGQIVQEERCWLRCRQHLFERAPPNLSRNRRFGHCFESLVVYSQPCLHLFLPCVAFGMQSKAKT